MAKKVKGVKRVGIVGLGFMGRMQYGNWKKMKREEVVALFAAAVLAAAQALAADIQWSGLGATPLYSDTNNWSGRVLPASGQCGNFSAASVNVRVSFPTNDTVGYAESSFSRFEAPTQGKGTVIDTRGTYWLKSGGNPTAFQGLLFSKSGSAHMVTVENLTGSTPGTSPIMKFSDGVICFTNLVTGLLWELESGTFDTWMPDGVTAQTAHQLVFNAARAGLDNSVVRFLGGSKLRAGAVFVSGGPANTKVEFAGGDHSILGALTIGTKLFPANLDTNATTAKAVVSGGSLAVSSVVSVGGRPYANSTFELNGTGRFIATNAVNIGTEVSATGTVTMAANSSAEILNALTVGNSGNSAGFWTMTDAAALGVSNTMTVANSAGTEASFSMDGYASLAAAQSVSVGAGASSRGSISLAGNAHAAMKQLTIGSGASSTGTVTLADNADATVSTGITIGTGTPGTGAHSFRMTGGSLTVGSLGFTVADGSSAADRIALDGGVLKPYFLKGGAGAATASADGGTIMPSQGNFAVIQPFAEFKLGGKGLTLDVGTFEGVRIEQAFTDADAETPGLFLKTGLGSAVCVSNSTHGVTVIAQGTLSNALAAAKIGREVVITNGAAFDMTGATTSLTAEKLTLGGADGTLGILKMDSNDVVNVTSAGGLAVNAGAILFASPAVPGAYTVFACAGEVTADSLKKLVVRNPVAGYSYAFVPVANGGGTDVRLTISPVSVTANEWNGSQGSAWATAGNWGAGVPTSAQNAVFPSTASAKAVTVASDASVQGLSFAGDYTLSGGSLTFLYALAALSGTTTVATPLTANGNVSFNVSTGAAVEITGTLSSVYALAGKIGAGRLSLAGNNTGFTGLWTVDGGLLDQKHPNALGAADSRLAAVTLVSGTIGYSGDAGGAVARVPTGQVI